MCVCGDLYVRDPQMIVLCLLFCCFEMFTAMTRCCLALVPTSPQMCRYHMRMILWVLDLTTRAAWRHPRKNTKGGGWVVYIEWMVLRRRCAILALYIYKSAVRAACKQLCFVLSIICYFSIHPMTYVYADF